MPCNKSETLQNKTKIYKYSFHAGINDFMRSWFFLSTIKELVFYFRPCLPWKPLSVPLISKCCIEGIWFFLRLWKIIKKSRFLVVIRFNYSGKSTLLYSMSYQNVLFKLNSVENQYMYHSPNSCHKLRYYFTLSKYKAGSTTSSMIVWF